MVGRYQFSGCIWCHHLQSERVWKKWGWIQLVPLKCYSVATIVCEITSQKETIFIPFNSSTVQFCAYLENDTSVTHPIFRNDMTNHTFARNTKTTYNYQNGILYKSVILRSSFTHYKNIYIVQYLTNPKILFT